MAQSKLIPSLSGGLFWLLALSLPLVSILSLQDFTLIPRWMLLAVYATLVFGLHRKIFKMALPGVLEVVAILFSLMGLLSVGWAYTPSEAWALSGRLLVLAPLLFALFYQIKSGALSREELLKGILIFATASAIPTLKDLLQSLGNGAFFNDIYEIKGSYSHKNLLASALMLSFPFVLAAWAILKGAWSRFALVLALILLFEMFVLRTRGVWLGLFLGAAGAGISIIVQKPQGVKVSRLWASVFGGGAILILLVLFASPKIKAGFTDSSNVQKRMAFWDNSWQMIQEHPVTGVGGGNWKILFPKYGLAKVDESVMQGQTHIQRPHNDYLWVWSELGIVGILLFLALFALPLIRLWGNVKHLESIEDRQWHLAALFSLVSLAVFSFSDFPLERAPHAFFWMLILAIAFSAGKEAKGLKGLTYLLPVMAIGALYINVQRYGLEQEAKILIEVDYEGATLAQRMQNQNQQAIQRERERIAAALSIQSEATYDPQWFTVDNFAMPVKYFDAKGKLYGGKAPLNSVKESIDLAMEASPYNILNYQMMVEYYDRLGNTDSVYHYIDLALEIAPKFQALLIKKAELLIREKRELDALGVLNLFPFESNNPRYLDLLSKCLVKAIQTYPAEHQRYQPMMQYFSQHQINSQQKLIAVYRRFRQEKQAALKD